MSNPVGTRKLVLKVETVDFSDAVKVASVNSRKADGGFGSFAEARAGGPREYVLKLTMKQDTDAASLWDYVWAHFGEEVDVEVWPHGGTTPGASTPKYTGTCIVAEPDGELLGGEANESTSARFTTEVEWVFLAKPTKVVA